MTSSTIKQEFSSSSQDDEILNLMLIAGLSYPQARVFLELVRIKESTAGDLCKITGIKDSRIYTILRELEQNGLLVVQYSSPKLYGAVSLDEGLQNLMKRQENEIHTRKEAIKQLFLELTPLFDSSKIPTAVAYIIKGKDNIFNKIHYEIINAKEEIVFRVPSIDFLNEFESILEESKKNGIQIKLASYCDKEESLSDDRVFYQSRCKCFYLLVDNEYLLSISNWDAQGIYAIWTTDTSLINIINTSQI
jgi:sugar-specific transcriptional regulator TrmB